MTDTLNEVNVYEEPMVELYITEVFCLICI
jgi:hypothetical protein